ncbi:hypothetical protein [Parapedobacter sp. 2B3]|uniref:hypothetical protein n=1 Tax=Parapedobacter sp. 2B3 TaxID=3342381 RepID=UPI0035B5E1E4
MNPNKKNEFDRQLAGKFESFRPGVPSGLWDKIASKLDEQEQSNIVPIKQQRRFPIRWISVAASVLVVCGFVYWYNRPVEVTYLQNPVAQEEEADAPAIEEPAHEPAAAVEPLDMDRLKQLFAKRNRTPKNESKQEIQMAETPPANRPAEAADSQPVITEETASPTQVFAKNNEQATPPSANQPVSEEAIAATVPDIQPPVIMEEEEETLLAAVEASKQPFGVSNILNYVVGAVDQRDEKLITFSNDGEGSLKLDFNFSLAKNKKKRIK